MLVALAACSGHSTAPNDADTAGAAGRTLAGTASSEAGRNNGGEAGGSAGDRGGGGNGGSELAGTVGAGGTLGAAGGAGTGGDATLRASATLGALQGSGVSGMAVFTQVADHLQLEITLTGCAAGSHALHLHANAACDDDGNAAGGHWSPQGEVVPDVLCAADGSGALSFDARPGAWSIGPPRSSDVLGHAVMLHAGASDEPEARIACGIPLKAP